jgi:hypothetical protein
MARKGSDMESVTDDTIKRSLRFTNEMCKDTNTYTADTQFWNIVKSGSNKLLNDEGYIRSIFPDLVQE